MRTNLSFLLAVFIWLSCGVAHAQKPFENKMITDEGAWCWFADPRALHYENQSGTINSTYVGYIDVHGAIKATQWNHLTNTTSEVLIRSYFQPDDHDNPSFLVLPDERVMIFYSRHTDEKCFYYRVSAKPGDITTLGDEKRLATEQNTTYPSPFILSDDPNHIYLCWRGINWHPTIAKLSVPDQDDEVSFVWGPKQIVQSTGARPYAKYVSNGKDKIYMTYTTGHPDNEQPNYIYCNYIDINDLKLKDVKGKVLSALDAGAHPVNKTDYATVNPDAVVDNSNFRDWVWEISLDAVGKPVIAMVRINGGKTSHDYYHAQWTGSEWKKTFLTNGGGAFHQSAGLEMCYSGGMALDKQNPNQVYCSQPIAGANGTVYEIVKYTVKTDGTVDRETVTHDSQKNNSRPYCISNSGNSPLLVWMNGEYYDWIVSSSRPKGYPTGIYGNFQLPMADIDLERDLIKKEEFKTPIDGVEIKDEMLVSHKNTNVTIVAANAAKAFTVSLSPYLSADAYDGKIVQIGNITYGLDASTLMPYLTIGDKTYKSTNRLGNSDSWKTANRGTGGEWWTIVKLRLFSLAFTYENGVLRTYINGLIDQSVDVANLTLGDVSIGGFEGFISDCSVYGRALAQDEVKVIARDLQAQTELSELLDIKIPEQIYTDIVLKSVTSSGSSIEWVTSNPALITSTGIVALPNAGTGVTLTAKLGSVTKDFNTIVMPRNIEHNKVLLYEFEAGDERKEGAARYITDKSGNGHDAVVLGNAKVNGKLDLTANTNVGFSVNGYAKAPEGILGGLRSYSFVATINPKRLDKAPRIYDFGVNSGNSLFGRASALSIGLKYNGGTTAMVNSTNTLSAGTEKTLAFTYDAKTHTAKIYMNAEQVATGNTITNEAYQLVEAGVDTRNYIGRTQWWDQSFGPDNVDFCGTIDDFYLFNIALTPSELEQLGKPSAMNAIQGRSSFGLYPNPANSNEPIYVDCPLPFEQRGELKVEMISAMGQVVKSYTSADSSLPITAPAEKGIYFVRITIGTAQVMTQKLLVK